MAPVAHTPGEPRHAGHAPYRSAPPGPVRRRAGDPRRPAVLGLSVAGADSRRGPGQGRRCSAAQRRGRRSTLVRDAFQ
ncbi:hypothetical protein ACPA9J_27855 [Pseudomonas aeruginosa]